MKKSLEMMNKEFKSLRFNIRKNVFFVEDQNFRDITWNFYGFMMQSIRNPENQTLWSIISTYCQKGELIGKADIEQNIRHLNPLYIDKLKKLGLIEQVEGQYKLQF